VAVLAGTAFGAHGEGYLRLSYANVNAQHNNVSGKSASELQNLVGSLNLGAMLSTHASLAISGSAVDLQQKDGLTHLSDSVRLNQRIYNFSVTPSFSFSNKTLAQSISPSFNYSLLDDHNSLTASSSNSNTISAVLSYSCSFIRQSWSLNGSALYNRYEQGISIYSSYGLNGGSSVQLLKQDGIQLGSLTGTSFDDHGRITLTYSNGQTKTPATLLLARIDEQQQLTPIGSGLFTAQTSTQPQFAPAQTAGLGRVVGGEIEQSNVDLTQQFSDLIIIQRGYQASSQTTSVANEMIQTLLQMGQHP